MEKNFQNFSVQEAIKLAKTDAGKQLIALLQQQNGKEIQNAMAQANAGDFSQAKQALNAILQNPEARALLQQLGREKHE
jgi:hypothetical protein